MISSLLGLLLRNATLSLNDSVVIFGAAAPARDVNSGDESWESPRQGSLIIKTNEVHFSRKVNSKQFYLRIYDVWQDATVPVAPCLNQYTQSI
jgi:hypothetical protein